MGRGVSPLDIFGYEFSHSLGRVRLLAVMKIAPIKWLLTGCKHSLGRGGQILEAFNPVSLLPFPTFIQVRQLGICDFPLNQQAI
jgi:hypothetical protein